MQPVTLTKTGTGIAGPIIPDIFQNPFQIGLGVQLITGGLTTAIVSIEHTFDYSTVMAPSFNGLTAVVNGATSTAIWFPNSGINNTTITANAATAVGTQAGNYAFPVAAMRLNVVSATATSLVVVTFIQASNAP